MAAKEFVLFRLEDCPYCRRAEAELDRRNIMYRRVEVGRDRSVVQLLSGQPTVPILVEVIGSKNQDDDIIRYLEEIAAKQ